MTAKGIILAGGAGTRLWPATLSVVKQLLPIYDKPMIYYPLTTLMTAGVQEFLLITQTANIPLYETLFGNGHELGISIRYAVQDEPKGIAQALTIADDCCFLEDAEVIALILGDNLFAGQGVTDQLREVLYHDSRESATIFVTEVRDPERYGVATFSYDRYDGELEPAATRRLVDIIEKPPVPTSNWAVTGLYAYPADVPARVRRQVPSARGELEITDLNKAYLQDDKLNYRRLGRGMAWLDTGTPEALLQANAYVEAIQSRHGIMLGCPEEVAFRRSWIFADDLERRAARYRNEYGDYLRSLPCR